MALDVRHLGCALPISLVVAFQFTRQKSFFATSIHDEIGGWPSCITFLKSGKENRPRMMDKLRRWAATAGMIVIGPLFLGFMIICLLRGELPATHSVLKAADHPIFFYPIIVVLLFGALKWAQISMLVVVTHFRGRARR